MLDEAISARGRALLAVSGASYAAKGASERLRQLEVDWSRVTLTLSDERWVPPDHPDSNETLGALLSASGAGCGSRFCTSIWVKNRRKRASPLREERLKALALPFDAVYLGMGSDGHYRLPFPSRSGDRCR